MKRFFNWIKGLFNKTMDKLEDPEIMLDQARRDMQQALVQNKERAVAAITQKNQLENMLKDEKKKANELESKAAMALKQGERELATQFMREKMNRDATIANLETSYQQALETVDMIKVGIKRQEEEVRKKAAEALALKAQWKNAQIQTSITKALEGLSFENEFEGFGAVEQRIREKQSEASARSELHSTSLSSKVMDMESRARDMEAENELDKLEERLGMRAPASPPVETVSVTTGSDASPSGTPGAAPVAPGEAEKALEELEKRLNRGN